MPTPPHVVIVTSNEYDEKVAVATLELLARMEIEGVVVKVPKRPGKTSPAARAVEAANRTKALIGVYLRRGESTSPFASGTEIQFTPGAQGLAQKALSQIVGRLHTQSRGHWPEGGSLLLARVPSIVVIPGFSTHASDAARLERFPGDYAAGLAAAIYSYFLEQGAL